MIIDLLAQSDSTVLQRSHSTTQERLTQRSHVPEEPTLISKTRSRKKIAFLAQQQRFAMKKLLAIQELLTLTLRIVPKDSGALQKLRQGGPLTDVLVTTASAQLDLGVVQEFPSQLSVQ